MTHPTGDNSAIEFLTPGSIEGAMKAAGSSSKKFYMVHPSMLNVIEGFNVRTRTPEYIAHVKWLKEQIKTNGYNVDEPLTGYVGKDPESGEPTIYVTDGHSRLEAINELIEEGFDFQAVPLMIKSNSTSQEDLTVDLITKNSGRPLTPLEIALVCKRLIGFGWDEKAIAARLGYGKKYVEDLLSLLGAPAAVRKLVETGKVSATLAISEVKKDAKGAAKKLTEAAGKLVETGKTKVTKKALGDAPAKVKPISATVIASHTDNPDDDFVTMLVQVPRESAYDIEGATVKLTVVKTAEEPKGETKKAKEPKAPKKPKGDTTKEETSSEDDDGQL
jgi:ParB family transcriptional regulator, chromosome partitioning protein